MSIPALSAALKLARPFLDTHPLAASLVDSAGDQLACNGAWSLCFAGAVPWQETLVFADGEGLPGFLSAVCNQGKQQKQVQVLHAGVLQPFALQGVPMDLEGSQVVLLALQPELLEVTGEDPEGLQQVADRAPVMIWMSGLQQETTFVNQRWLAYTGRAIEQDLGYGWFELVHPEDLDHCAHTCKQAYDQQTDFAMEFRMRRLDGEYRWLVNRGVRRYAAGAFVGFIGACIDIHDRKLAEQQVQESEQKMREVVESQKRFLADAAHELRNPLTAIQGNMDLLVRYQDIPEEEKREIIQDVQKESSRLRRLVQDMLQLARGDAGAALHEDEVQLEEVLLEAFRDLERLSKHTLLLDPLVPVQVLGDADRLKQLCIILLENALKYTPPAGTVRAGLQLEGETVVLRIADTGIGISEEDLDRVFERFYRVDRSRQPGADPGGTGLGLPIAKWIVEQHGGTIHLESVLGTGTTAVVRLPLEQQP